MYKRQVITAFPVLLRDGSEVMSARIRKDGGDLWLAEVAEGLDWAPLKATSLGSALAPVNKFLRLSENLAREAREQAQLLGLAVQGGQIEVIAAVGGTTPVHSLEVAALKQNSMFGNVAKFAPKGIERARGISYKGGYNTSPRHDWDFPRESLAVLIHQGKTWRDKTLWLMLTATGIRISEALNLLLDDIDLENQRIFVFDPNARRARLSVDEPHRLRFKGREVAYTYPIPELKRDLFRAIQEYLELEYVPCRSLGDPNYFFQYVEASRRGQPYVDASAGAINQNFRRACKAADVPAPFEGGNWGVHSLRHTYGVYWVNDFPVNPQLGLFGLSLVHVQLMMGHKSIKTTSKYARAKHRRIEACLRASDEAMLGMSEEDFRGLPGFNVRLMEATE